MSFFFEDTPFIASGRRDIDGYTSVLWVLVVGCAVGSIAYHFFHATIDLQAESRTSRRRRNIRKWEVGGFLLIALIAFTTVNWLRFEHRRLKLASWAEIEQWRSDHPDLWIVGKKPESFFMNTGREFTEKLTHAADLSDVEVPSASDVKKQAKDTFRVAKMKLVNARAPKADKIAQNVKQGAEKVAQDAGEAAKGGFQRVKGAVEQATETFDDWRKQGSRWLFNSVPIPNEHAHTFPWPLGPKKETSMWDFFKTLVDEPLHFWWTQQWMSGYLAWAVFVGIESRNRNIPAFAFIVFGYCFSLAAAQSLYYALILLKPALSSRRRQSWMPHPLVAILPIAFETVGLARLPQAYYNILSDKGTLFLSAPVFFNILQAVLVALPAVIALVIRDYLPLSWGTRRASPTEAKKDLQLFWYIVSLLAFTGHIYHMVRATQQAATATPRWTRPMDYLGIPKPGFTASRKSGYWSILGQLGSHDWLGAVAWDVVLSTFSLCMWAHASSADVRSMLKCSVWPWIDETIELGQEGAEVLQKNTEPYLEAMQEGVEHFQEVGKPYANLLRKRGKRAMKSAEPYLETAQEYMEEGLGQAGRYAQNAANLAAAQLSHTDYGRNARNIVRAVGYQGDEEQDDHREMPDGDNDLDDSEWTEARKNRASSPKKRGRPAKASRTASKSPAPADRRRSSRSRARTVDREASPAKRRSSRNKDLATTSVKPHFTGHGRSARDQNTEPWYHRVQPPSVSNLEMSQEFAGDFEAAALTWGLWFIGGLGLASAGVFGGDET